MQASKFCTTLCPNGYYPNKTDNNCELCYEGCQMCYGPTLNECLMKNVAGPGFYKNIGFNILVIVFGVALIAMGAYCFIRKCLRNKQAQVLEVNNDLGKKMVN